MKLSSHNHENTDARARERVRSNTRLHAEKRTFILNKNRKHRDVVSMYGHAHTNKQTHKADG